MNPAVCRPARVSRVCCSMGSRTRAWMPLMKTRPCACAYLSSRLRDARALSTDSGRGAFIVGPPFQDVPDRAPDRLWRPARATGIHGFSVGSTHPTRVQVCCRKTLVFDLHSLVFVLFSL